MTYSACEPFAKHRERIRKYKGTANLKHLYKNELDKSCFTDDATCSDNKDLAKRTISDKILKIELMKLLEIAIMMDIKKH